MSEEGFRREEVAREWRVLDSYFATIRDALVSRLFVTKTSEGTERERIYTEVQILDALKLKFIEATKTADMLDEYAAAIREGREPNF